MAAVGTNIQQRVVVAQEGELFLNPIVLPAVTTTASTTVNTASATQELIGRSVSGTFIAAGSYVVSAVTGVSITLSAAATAGTADISLDYNAQVPNSSVALPANTGYLTVILPCWVTISTGVITAPGANPELNPLLEKQARAFKIPLYT
jgi:hypothetical protein